MMCTDVKSHTGGIVLRGVEKTYRLGSRTVRALAGVDITIEPGEFVAIMGASGSGKSTLLHLCALLDTPDAGTIMVDGRNLAELSEREATVFRRQTVGVVFQNFNLIPTLPLLDNILLTARLSGQYSKAVRTRAVELATALGLANRLTHRPDALSGGEQQRTAIARALLLKPRVLLADEPTGNLDSSSSENFWRMLKSVLASTPTTVVVVTHEPAAAAYAHRVLVLRDGRLSGAFGVQEHDDAGNIAARYQHALA
ncbi:MAG: ABC transporter ATP-binding protein [Planctomycetia bacterium]|nr:ABC transporter ATP-binding protein [Planctomycetia bacterium]